MTVPTVKRMRLLPPTLRMDVPPQAVQSINDRMNEIKNEQTKHPPARISEIWPAFLTFIKGRESFQCHCDLLRLFINAAYEYIDAADEEGCEMFDLPATAKNTLMEQLTAKTFPFAAENTEYSQDQVHMVLFTVEIISNCMCVYNLEAPTRIKRAHRHILGALDIYLEQQEGNVTCILQRLSKARDALAVFGPPQVY